MFLEARTQTQTKEIQKFTANPEGSTKLEARNSAFAKVSGTLDKHSLLQGWGAAT